MNRLYLLFLGLLLSVRNDVTAAVTCAKGYEVSGDTCIDEDECNYEDPICGDNAVCYNTNGSYYCQCVTGYQTPSRTVNFTQSEQCKDINECVENKPICGPNAECTNIRGSFYCTCRSGFVSSTGQERFNASQSVTCEDEDECEYEDLICGDNAVCYNTNGSYYCQCVTGYQTPSRTVNFTAVEGEQCKDINECVENKPICGPNAECTNIRGSFYCTCRSGFVSSTGQERFNAGQSVTCEDKSITDEDECEYENPVCGDNAVCYNTEDINECVENKPICGSNAECTNIRGSFYCTCGSGFVSSTGQERFNAGQNVTCRETPDAEHQEIGVFCIKDESSTGQQQLNPTVLMFLPLILWIMMFYQ